ncbi:MAG: extracellular solute-binding protein [Anaerolineae bacterium]|nr:extracellular solute-binding protein [Anaerolineae bacterium]
MNITIRWSLSFAAGTDHDVVYVRDSFLAEWASAGWIQPITGLPGVEELLADLPQGIIDQMTYNGEVYGLPYYSGTSVLAFNNAHLMQAAGVGECTCNLGTKCFNKHR